MTSPCGELPAASPPAPTVRPSPASRRPVDAGPPRRGPRRQTVRRVHALLSSALTAAQKLDLVEDNAASKVHLPAARAARKTPWEPQQVAAFLDAAATVRIGPLYELAVFSGLRRGELVGLKWADVDLARRELVVRQQRVQVGGRVVEGDAKTDSSQHRHVSLGDGAVGSDRVADPAGRGTGRVG